MLAEHTKLLEYKNVNNNSKRPLHAGTTRNNGLKEALPFTHIVFILLPIKMSCQILSMTRFHKFICY